MPEFKYFCQLRFGPLIRRNKLGELSILCQTETASEYQKKFQLLLMQVSKLTAEQGEIFLRALRDYIAVDVEIHCPTDLTTIINLACKYGC